MAPDHYVVFGTVRVTICHCRISSIWPFLLFLTF